MRNDFLVSRFFDAAGTISFFPSGSGIGAHADFIPRRKTIFHCRAIRKASLEDVRLLLNVLGTKMALEGESVYGAPFEAMKELLDFYRTSLAIRRGRNAAEEEKKESESDVDVPAESETL